MRRAVLWLGIGLVSACGSSPTFDAMAAFTHSDAFLDATDAPNPNGTGFLRSLHFTLFPNYTYGASKPSDCASLGDATVTFAGRPVVITDVGGFHPNGECAAPILGDVSFDMPAGEPQNGTLVIDGSAVHLEATFKHDFGEPTVSLVSVAADKIIASLRGFAKAPTLFEVQALIDRHVLTGYPPTGTAPVKVTALAADGQLEIAIPPGYVSAPPSTTLQLRVHLGDDQFACEGFFACMGSSNLYREFAVDLPAP